MSEEDLLKFPCEVPIKVFVNNEPRFRERVIAMVRTQFVDLDDNCVTEQLSKGGRFVSLTIRVVAEDREQLDAVYRKLSASDDVLMAL